MSTPTNFRELFEHLETCPRVRIHRKGLGSFEAEFYHRDTAGRLCFRAVARRGRPGPIFEVSPDEDLSFEPEAFSKADHDGSQLDMEYLP